jgi:membrane protease subunit (stomatin/prohibitin family)
LGGQDLSVCGRDNTVFLNATTNFKQTVEAAEDITVTSSPYSIDFNDGAIKYINSVTTDFQVDFTNVPAIPNTTITYTLIINQGATPYMITDVTVNTVSQTIKWANATEPEGNASQIDIIGLMFIFNGSGSLSQVLGQMGTFA